MKRIYLVFLLMVFLTATLSAQVDSLDANFAVSDTQDVKVTLFDTDDLLEISLKFDINKYKRYKSDTLYLPAVLTYHLSETDSVVKNLKVRARGNIRRTDNLRFSSHDAEFQGDGFSRFGIFRHKQTQDSSLLQGRLRTIHTEGIPGLQTVQYCNRSQSESKAFQDHLPEHRKGKETTYPVWFCNRACRSAGTADRNSGG